jgi:hypothetical protein
MGASALVCDIRAVYLGGEDRPGAPPGLRPSGSRLVVLSGGVAPVVGGLVRLAVAQFDLLGRDGCHQSVDRHACETHRGPGYDGDSADLFDVT